MKRSLLLASAIAILSLCSIAGAEARIVAHFSFGPPLYVYYPPPAYVYYPPISNVAPPLPQVPTSPAPTEGKHPSIACIDGRDQIIYTSDQRQDTRCN